MRRLAAAIEGLALALFVALIPGLFDGWRATPLPSETLAERLRSTVALDLVLLSPLALALALVSLARPREPGARTGLALLFLAGLALGAVGTLPGAARPEWLGAALRLHLPIPKLRVPAGEEARPIVLISIDTLRADARMPALERRAGGALRYTSARANAPWTLPSVASLMTGRLPHEHGAGARLDPEKTGVRSGILPEVPTLAERLAEAGYLNFAVLTNAYLDPEHGLTRGFDRANDLTRQALLFRGLRRSLLLEPALAPRDDGARAVTDRAIEVLERVHEGRFFLWIHYIDPHAPYRATPGDPGVCEPPDCWDGWAAMRRERRGPEAGEQATARRLYGAELARLDAELERLFAALDAKGLLSRALIVALSDHGEELGDHGGGEHGATFFEEVVRVPLYLWVPGRAGQEVKHSVSLADTHAALLQWADGGALGPLEPGAPDATVGMSSLLFGPDEGSACVRGGLKLTRVGSAEALYDLMEDPGESNNRIADPTLAAALTELRACLPPPPRAGPGGTPGETPGETPGKTPRDPLGGLRALGYVE